MKRRNLRSKMGVGLVALALGVSLASVAAFAQYGPYYPSDRKLNDNGSVYEPGPAPSARQPVRREHLFNYAPQGQYYPTDRKLDDNGSVDEPGPGR